MKKGIAFPSRRPAVFLDRDGVLNRDTGYPSRIEDIEWSLDAAAAVRLCNERGFLVFVVTNQSGVARGYFDETAAKALHIQMRARIAEEGATIHDFRYCPHLENAEVSRYRTACACRKPKPGMIIDLLAAWQVDEAHAFLVGDKETDIMAATAAGIPGYLFSGGSLAAFIAPLLDRHDPVRHGS